MQYREDLPPVLKGLNVHIQPKEKIGTKFQNIFSLYFAKTSSPIKKVYVEELVPERVRSFKRFSEWWRANQVKF